MEKSFGLIKQIEVKLKEADEARQQRNEAKKKRKREE